MAPPAELAPRVRRENYMGTQASLRPRPQCFRGAKQIFAWRIDLLLCENFLIFSRDLAGGGGLHPL